MKKTLSLILILTLVFAMSVPAFAANETDGNTDVTYTVGANYTIVIPNAVSITNGTGTQTVAVSANSVIPANDTLDFKITGATNYDGTDGFRLKNDVGTDIYLGYTITYPSSQTIGNLDTIFLSATATEAYTGKSVVLTYTTDTVEAAGTYTDSLTFTVGLTAIS